MSESQKHRGAASRHAGKTSTARNSAAQSSASGNSAAKVSIRVREWAKAGASGAVLTDTQIREVCEALHARVQSVRNQFHSGN